MNGPASLDRAFATLSPTRATRAYAAGEEVFGQGEAADYVYKLLAGAVRSYRVLSDGRRQISDFFLPGDFIGLDALTVHQASAEAVTPLILLCVRRSALAALAKSDAELAAELWERAIAGAHRSQEHASILGRLGASERVAGFLMAFARRTGGGLDMELPMTRQDIADYLGLTIHTVSRTLSLFQEQGLIDAQSARRIRLSRSPELAQLCA